MSKFDWYLFGLIEGVGVLILLWALHKLFSKKVYSRD